MSRKKPTFSKPFDEAMIHAELVQEMMNADDWIKPDVNILAKYKKYFDTYARHADAALRVFKRIEERENNIRPSET